MTGQQGGFNWKFALIGLALVLPLLGIMAAGLDLDPHRMDSPLAANQLPAPEFSLPLLESDGDLQLSELRGKPVVLNFWATWCVPCAQEHPLMVQAAGFYGERAHFIGVAYQDNRDAIRAWLRRNGGQAYPILIDVNAKAAIAYGVYGVPETYVIDKEGVVRWKKVGPMSAAELRQNLEPLL